MPTKPIGPDFWTMSCCIFAISLSADCLTDDSKSQSTPSSHLSSGFESHRLSVYHISSFVLVYPPCWSLFQAFWIFNCISFHNLAFHSQLAIATPHACDIAFRFAVLPHTTLPQQKFMCWVWRAEKLHPISKRKQLRYLREVETRCFGRGGKIRNFWLT